MTELPTLPTDNLYKFATVCGLALCVSGFLLMKSSSSELPEVQVAIAEFPRNADVVYGQNLADRFRQADEKLRTALALQDAADAPEKEGMQPEVQRLFEEAYKLGYQRVDWSDNVDVELAKLRSKSEDIARSFSAGESMFYFGACVMVLGLISWYWLHQRFQDLILKTSAKSPKGSTVKAKHQ